MTFKTKVLLAILEYSKPTFVPLYGNFRRGRCSQSAFLPVTSSMVGLFRSSFPPVVCAPKDELMGT